jgi:hypothetical protein
MLSSRRSLLLVLFLAAALTSVLLLVVVGAKPSSARRAAASQPAGPLDHYTCYPVTSTTPFTSVTVGLRDQFDTAGAGPRATQVLAVQSLCAPTSKTVAGQPPTPVNNPEAHLVCHTIKDVSGQPFVPHTVRVFNQFSPTAGAVLKVTAISTLCLPSLKSLQGPPTGSPPQISHYKCYAVSQTSPRFVPRTDVSLSDQFGTSHPVVFSPIRLCNPVEKTVGGTVYPIITQEHLVCYPIKIRAFILQQLASLTLLDKMGRTLCLPSQKTIIS